MNKNFREGLEQKYKMVVETHTIKEFDFGSGGEMSTADVGESEVNQNEPQVALDWRIVGLYEPDEKTIKETEAAIKELSEVVAQFSEDLDKWHKKYSKLGSLDTVSREQVANFIAKSVLGLIRLD